MKLSRVTVALNQLRHSDDVTITEYLNLFDDLAKDIQEETGKPLYDQSTGEGLELAKSYIRLLNLIGLLFKKNGPMMTDTRLFSKLEKSEGAVSQINDEMKAMRDRLAELGDRDNELRSLEDQIGSLEQNIKEKERLIAAKEKDLQEAEKLKAECQTYLNAISELENKTIPLWSSRLEEMKNNYQTEDGKLKKTQQEYKDMENELGNIKRQGQELISSLQQMIAEKTRYQSQLSEQETTLKNEVSKLEAIIIRDKEQVKAQQAEHDTVKKLADELKTKLAELEKESPELSYLKAKNQMIRDLWLAYGLDQPDVMAFEKSELPRLEAMRNKIKNGLDEEDRKLSDLSKMYEKLLLITEYKEA